MLSLLTLLATPLILLWMTVYRRVNNKYHHRIREMNSIINAAMAQYVDGISIIQQFNKEENMLKISKNNNYYRQSTINN